MVMVAAMVVDLLTDGPIGRKLTLYNADIHLLIYSSILQGIHLLQTTQEAIRKFQLKRNSLGGRGVAYSLRYKAEEAEVPRK